jgi:hypothetical protein
MPLGREYRPVVGSVDVSGYPCIPRVAQSLLEPAMRFRTKAYVPMRLDTGGRGGQCDHGRLREGYLWPPRCGPVRMGVPLKFSPYFHGTGF